MPPSRPANHGPSPPRTPLSFFLFFSFFFFSSVSLLGHATRTRQSACHASSRETRPSLRRNQRRFIEQIGSSPSARGGRSRVPVLVAAAAAAEEQRFSTPFCARKLIDSTHDYTCSEKRPLHDTEPCGTRYVACVRLKIKDTRQRSFRLAPRRSYTRTPLLSPTNAPYRYLLRKRKRDGRKVVTSTLFQE